MVQPIENSQENTYNKILKKSSPVAEDIEVKPQPIKGTVYICKCDWLLLVCWLMVGCCNNRSQMLEHEQHHS